MQHQRHNLTGLGWIELIDSMGSDASIVDAARISYGEGTRSVSDDRTLIRYLMRHRHTTPFEMPSLQFRVRCPMDVWRQWIRHRTASVNEYSTRYSEAIDDMAETSPTAWRLQDGANKQGSAGHLDAALGAELSEGEATLHEALRHCYRLRLDLGVAREQARKDLPLSQLTEAIWKMDLHNLLHFLKLRLDPHAQLEIRLYAEAIGEIVAGLFPITWEAFQDYHQDAITLTGIEARMLRRASQTGSLAGPWFDDAQPDEWARLKRCRERDEALAKFERLDLLRARTRAEHSTGSRTATDEQPSPRRGPGRRMDQTGLIHLAGPIDGQVQKCTRCGAILEDSRGAQANVRSWPGPRGWMEGPVTFYGVQGGFRIAGRQSDAVDCVIYDAPRSA